ncbi:histidinol-phosphate aminotransferase protein [Rutstroemia sp. NJR-2017a BVV2]|nr:histidinol-phosphate aminotransferase protein [Rutstroemia sp. NJR-2017a BVV2]
MAPNQSPFNLQTCARANILALEPYRCARDDYKDDGTNILLDANENAYGPSLPSSTTSNPSLNFLGLNRYPDPHQHPLKSLLCQLRNTHHHTPRTLTPANLFLGVGSDEAIDALLRCFCVPSQESILVCPPTYGMYSVSACVNDVALVKVPLRPAPTFDLDVEAILSTLSSSQPKPIKLIYICSPGNPTGALIPKAQIQQTLEHPTWNGIVVVDEAYIDFSPEGSSLAEWVTEWPNLVVLQTLSKAFGLAGIRLGAAFASPEVAGLLNNLKAPYNISSPTEALASQALQKEGLEVMRGYREKIVRQRKRMLEELPKVKGMGRFRGGEDSNFLLVEVCDKEGKPNNEVARRVYERLAEGRGVVVRFRGKEHGCEGCVRITVGTEDEVTRFLGEIGGVIKEIWTELEKSSAQDGEAEEKREVEASGVVA